MRIMVHPERGNIHSIKIIPRELHSTDSNMDSDSENNSSEYYSEGKDYDLEAKDLNVPQKSKKSSAALDLSANNDGNIPLYKLLQHKKEMKASNEAQEHDDEELAYHKKRRFRAKNVSHNDDYNLGQMQ